MNDFRNSKRYVHNEVWRNADTEEASASRPPDPSSPFIADPDLTVCPCGCGETFSPIGSRGRPRSYFSPACSLRVNFNREPTFTGRTHTPEARAKISASASRPRPWLRGEANGMYGRTGTLNPNYRDGSSPERQRLYAGTAWRTLRRQVRARDGGRCVLCGSSDQIHLHHVKPWAGNPDLRFDVDNVVSLCRDCHHAEHRKEVRHQ